MAFWIFLYSIALPLHGVMSTFDLKGASKKWRKRFFGTPPIAQEIMINANFQGPWWCSWIKLFLLQSTLTCQQATRMNSLHAHVVHVVLCGCINALDDLTEKCRKKIAHTSGMWNQKTNENISRISALASKNWSNQKNKDNFILIVVNNLELVFRGYLKLKSACIFLVWPLF